MRGLAQQDEARIPDLFHQRVKVLHRSQRAGKLTYFIRENADRIFLPFVYDLVTCPASYIL
jgi:hypothetical protein